MKGNLQSSDLLYNFCHLVSWCLGGKKNEEQPPSHKGSKVHQVLFYQYHPQK
jgi:hypothetical protein